MVDNSKAIKMIANDECIKDCSNCPLFLKKRKECYYEADKKWQEWNKKKKQERGKLWQVQEN